MSGEGSDADHDATPKRGAASADPVTPSNGQRSEQSVLSGPSAEERPDSGPSSEIFSPPLSSGVEKVPAPATGRAAAAAAGTTAGGTGPAGALRRGGSRIAAAPVAVGRRLRSGISGIGSGMRSGRASIRRSLTLAGDRILSRSETVNDRAAVLALVVFGLGVFALLVGFTTKWTVYGVAVTFFDGQSVSIALIITAALIAGTALLTGRYHLLALAPTFSAAGLVVLIAELIEGPLGNPNVTVGFGGYTALIVGLVQCVVGTYATGAASVPTTRFLIPVAAPDTAGSGRDVDPVRSAGSTPQSLGDVVAVPAGEAMNGSSDRGRRSGGPRTSVPASSASASSAPTSSAPTSSAQRAADGSRPAGTAAASAAANSEPRANDPWRAGAGLGQPTTRSDRTGTPADHYPIEPPTDAASAPEPGASTASDPRSPSESRPTPGSADGPESAYGPGSADGSESAYGSGSVGDRDQGDRASGGRSSGERELVAHGPASSRRSARDLDAAGIDVPRYLGPPQGTPSANYPLPGGDGGRRPTRPQYRYGASMGASPYRRPRNPVDAYPVIGEQARPARPAAPEPEDERPAAEESPAMGRNSGDDARAETPPALDRPAESADGPDGSATARGPEAPPAEEPPTMGRAPG